MTTTKVADWSEQPDMLEQAQFLRSKYGELRLIMESVPGGPGSFARGVMLLACNVLHEGAETIEERYAEKLMEKKDG
jgi:hypothetical protein